MGNRQLILRGLAAVVLLSGSLALVGCSRPTPGPDQQTPAPPGADEGYPDRGLDEAGTPGPSRVSQATPPTELPSNPTYDGTLPGLDGHGRGRRRRRRRGGTGRGRGSR